MEYMTMNTPGQRTHLARFRLLFCIATIPLVLSLGCEVAQDTTTTLDLGMDQDVGVDLEIAEDVGVDAEPTVPDIVIPREAPLPFVEDFWVKELNTCDTENSPYWRRFGNPRNVISAVERTDGDGCAAVMRGDGWCTTGILSKQVFPSSGLYVAWWARVFPPEERGCGCGNFHTYTELQWATGDMAEGCISAAEGRRHNVEIFGVRLVQPSSTPDIDFVQIYDYTSGREILVHEVKTDQSWHRFHLERDTENLVRVFMDGAIIYEAEHVFPTEEVHLQVIGQSDATASKGLRAFVDDIEVRSTRVE
jgi:hypothetical protein